MPVSGTPPAAAVRPHPAKVASEVLTAISMTLGRGPAAHAMADLAMLTPGDQVVDIGCGPGMAARAAARRCACATGVDPAPMMLADDLKAAGFGDVHTEVRQARRRTLVIVRGSRPDAQVSQNDAP